MNDVFKVHESARIRTGKYAGLVGTVTETVEEEGQQTGVEVCIQGVREGVTVDKKLWFKRSQVERNAHG
ncbi:hypothetical protein KUF54_07105 [Comamonas sp. Y33R10-2]|uniref:hypothetical protein n=1 Tax=Comamonas sp. Y33R10-2 TaxID=2853257 RepID=UPI001C5CB622|nr:hypothetical protein [Comamonas sp. Y33R10-2]QXZ10954.1 hypothetical protein KUF54_07105 [Comamonas sp. Y33R10-2]